MFTFVEFWKYRFRLPLSDQIYFCGKNLDNSVQILTVMGFGVATGLTEGLWILHMHMCHYDQNFKCYQNVLKCSSQKQIIISR